MLVLRRTLASTTTRAFAFTVFLVVLLLAGIQYSVLNTHAKSVPARLTQVDTNRPVLSFFYPWYTSSDWCSCHMSDLPASRYNSNDSATINRQVQQAADAGINGFISSWWGPGDKTDNSFQKVLNSSAALQQRTGYHFASTIYFESDSPHLQGQGSIASGLSYVIAHYSHNANFIRWNGKPIIFIWDPLGGGRTLSEWSSILNRVDPRRQVLWSAEGVDVSLLNVFDGIHLFSGGYWGLQHGNMRWVDQDFRNQVNAYNAQHRTHKIWAAGVVPGFNDTRVPGRTNPIVVPRNNGANYRYSWDSAIASNPDWITVTSFNEWYEGSMIEPSVSYGNQYLDITKAYTSRWHS